MEHLFYEIFEQLPRVGPGNNESTRNAFKAINADSTLSQSLNILDIGCGTGIHTLQLADLIDGKITALDNHQGFLDILQKHLITNQLANKVQWVKGDMKAMEFETQSFYIIWSEGSIFIIGFERGLKEWKRFLKPNGYIALTDLFWLKPNPPLEIKAYFDKISPGLLRREQAIKIIEQTGYDLIHHFQLPVNAWWDDFYLPMEAQLGIIRKKYKGNLDAGNLIDSFHEEIDMFRKYSEYYGYIFFIVKIKE
jgi:ubiquinone/menaquinone biosynthesis C-methylase UbiE